ncbi:DNA helicase [Loigolactobacillus backii]|uniref:DnaB-like helicase C-terminal domain-containing protein n=1 Tax=Loigolactobacillus backii TaxID=375175 RepID=UPI000C1CA3D0|nr:DnaB-like helicase C-terminal domain-containing protein [Loigolactobacillus backii]PIO83044.1 DNA helicase [Loigolactobacillus backii]
MMFEIQICAYLLLHPEVIKTKLIQPKWLGAEHYRTLLRFILDNRGEFKSANEIQTRFLATFPAELDEQQWQEMRSAKVSEASFNDAVHGLHFWYLQGEIQAQASAYTKYPSVENLDFVLQLGQELHDMNLPALPTKPLSDYGADLLHYLDNPRPTGIKTFADVDSVLGNGLHGGVLWTIGARPGVGKSAFGLNLIQSALRIDPQVVADLFSLEMTGEDNFYRTVSYHTGIPVNKFSNPAGVLTGNEKASVKKIVPNVVKQKMNLHDKILVLPQIIKVIRDNARRAPKGKYFAVIDYLQITSLERVQARSSDRRLEIEQITRELKLLTNELDIPIVLFSQLNRELEKRPDKTPQLADLRESGSIEQDSNVVAFLYCPNQAEERQTERHVNLLFKKNRSGSLAELSFLFLPRQMIFLPQHGEELENRVK